MKKMKLERKTYKSFGKISKQVRLVVGTESTQWIEDDEFAAIELAAIALDHGFNISESDVMVLLD